MHLFHPNDYTNCLHVRDTNGWNVFPLIASQIQLVRFFNLSTVQDLQCISFIKSSSE